MQCQSKQRLMDIQSETKPTVFQGIVVLTVNVIRHNN